MAWITFSFRHLRFDGVEKADELLVSVMLHVAPDDGAVEDVESGEQCGRAVTPVVVGHGSGAALLHRQTGLSAVERLDLAFFIDRENHGMSRRIDIEADMSRSLVINCGSVESLNYLTRCGCKPCARQMR